MDNSIKIFGLIIILFLNGCAQDKDVLIKSIKTVTGTAIEQVDEIIQDEIKRDFDDGAIDNQNSIVNFDKEGRVLRKMFFQSDLEVNFTQNYEYNNLGDVTLVSNFQDGNLVGKEYYKYDEYNRLFGVKTIEADGSVSNFTMVTYEDNNNTVITKYYKSDDFYSQGILQQTQIEKFDSNKNLIYRRVEFGEDMEVYQDRFKTYQYDSLNQLILIESYQKDMPESFINNGGREASYSKYQEEEFEYDEFGNVVKDFMFHDIAMLSKNYKYVYQYNDFGDWIKCVRYQNEIPMFITLRDISYY
ncbi:hypothetical protein [Algoriphagus pacificus]|uniref:YD repeat-containing protein n=1 Tax=Algoriphagus pacificus TaxID=2811234 RepID=A0ABS3CKV1_9BACT|nr:hypothetical protein [Algoriphagus pacificus]MBN7816796.1 hypothetical protein [Algoriphagus pacificus]